MPRPSHVWLPALLAVLSLVSVAAPAAAHPGLTPVASTPARIDVIEPVLAAAPAMPPLPLHLLIALALLGAAAWLRPRRTVAVVLALLLSVFAFENGLHSVHHGFDAKQYRDCAIASASAHLAVVEADCATDAVQITLVAERPTDSASAAAPSRIPRPAQGRAPPAEIR